MGYDRHHAILVTTFSPEYADEAHAKALEVFTDIAPVTPLMPSPLNGWLSFVVLPDGSKEGWEDSDRGDEARETFLRWMDSRRYSDGGSRWDWAEVQYGDSEQHTEVTAHSDEDERYIAGGAE